MLIKNTQLTEEPLYVFRYSIKEMFSNCYFESGNAKHIFEGLFLCLLFAHANTDTMQSCRNFDHYFI